MLIIKLIQLELESLTCIVWRLIMIPLCLAEKGEPQIVKKIGGNPEIRQHLENLGFNIGGEVLIVNTLGENIIVKVKEARIAISDELARKIMV